MAFERTEEYMAKIMCDALDREVMLDAPVTFVRRGGKIKAYCAKTATYLQFPRVLRKLGSTCYADLVKSSNASMRTFYRAYPGSIRKDSIDSNPVA